MAEMSQEFVEAISPEFARTAADTLVAEVLPLLASGRFLEREAEEILAIRRLGRRGLPPWLRGVRSEVHRAPFGRILIIAPSNYPLFLPGVQALQALVAGNSVVWKPGIGGRAVALVFARTMKDAGLPDGLLRVTDESIEAAEDEITAGIDKVFFTGSATAARSMLSRLAETLTPCVVELSGCDAVVILPSANLSKVVKALAFGMRLNGSATCMAPRRVLLVDPTKKTSRNFVSELQQALAEIPAITIPAKVRLQLASLVHEAEAAGATVLGDVSAEKMKPVLILGATSSMAIADGDIFAPVLMIMTVTGESGVLAAQESCRFALTASIFGEERESRRLASRLTVGTVFINDLIVQSADPRLPFGGRRQSGFGVTRGAEGLLEMTAVKAIAVRRGSDTRHYEATTKEHRNLFDGIIRVIYASRWRTRLLGLKQVLAAAKRLKDRNED